MSKNQRTPYPLRMGETLEAFVHQAVKKSGRSKNAVIKACIQVAKENEEQLIKKIGVENAETAE